MMHPVSNLVKLVLSLFDELLVFFKRSAILHTLFSESTIFHSCPPKAYVGGVEKYAIN